MDYFRFQQALRLIEQQAAARRRTAQPAPPDAQEVAPAEGAHAAERWHGHAAERQRDGDHAAALAAWERALASGVEDFALLDAIAEGLRDAGHDPVAVAERAWPEPALSDDDRRGPGGSTWPHAWRRACTHALVGNWTQAVAMLEARFKSDPRHRACAGNLAFALEHQGKHGRARCVRATSLLGRGQPEAAVEQFLAAPETEARSPEWLGRFLSALRAAGRETEAVGIAEAASAHDACPFDARMEWVEALLDLQRHDEAGQVLRAGATHSSDAATRFKAGQLLPPVPASQDDMDRMHRRAHAALRSLDDLALPGDAARLQQLADLLEPNFYLAYLGEPLVEELRAHGRFVRRAMSAVFPAHAQPIPPRPRAHGERIRIGYATRGTTNLAVAMRYLAGWLQHADRSSFELHLFPLEHQHDWMSGYLSSLVDHRHEPPADVEGAARRIRDAGLDILLYPEIGLDPMTMRLAALRLAPVQCVANGHPVSSGLGSLDYFISNDAMEPGDAAAHYSEHLVTLPGIGLCLPPSPRPESPKSRSALGLPDQATLYLCGQSLFKYLPRHDDLYARIAQAVEDAVFVFVEGHYPAWTRTLRTRLAAAFASIGLDADKHLRFLPRLNYEDYLHLNLASDVFLDPIGWSGGLTALDAISCDLPLVILPGALMRGRQSYGWLRQMGIEDTIASDVDDYVRIAVGLGLDAGARADLSRRLRERRHLLFDQAGCVQSLEAFYRWAAGRPRPGDDTMFRRWLAPD